MRTMQVPDARAQAAAPAGRKPWYKSLRFQILALMLVCYLTPTMLLGHYLGGVFLKNAREKTEAALTSGAEYALTMCRQNIDQAVDLAKGATYDGELTGVYSQYADGSISDAAYLRQSRGYLERKYSRNDLFTFAGYFPVADEGLFMYTRSGQNEALLYQQDAHDTVAALGETLDTRCEFVQAGEQVYLVRNLMNLRMERYGMLVLGVDMRQLLAPFWALAEEWDAQAQVRLGQSGDLSVDWDGLIPGLGGYDRDSVAYTAQCGGRDYALDVRLIVSRDRLYGEMQALRRMMICLLIMLIPILLVIGWFVHRRIVRPVTLLSEASRRIEAGELGVTVPMHGGDELGDLGVAFSKMSRRIAELIDKTYKEEIALRDARIQAMQSRINPHFINNALESINWKARMEGSEAISTMVESLSVLLNASMARKNRRMVPVSEEAVVAQAYFYFVKQRFGDHLTVHQHVDADALDAQLPLLTIQPLLENAVEHGIGPAGGGVIELDCRRRGDRLLVEVVNSGKPISPEDRARIDASLAGDNQGGTHLGLANISNRLRLIYGGGAEIRVTSDDKGRTVVRLDIPQNTVAEEEEP